MPPKQRHIRNKLLVCSYIGVVPSFDFPCTNYDVNSIFEDDDQAAEQDRELESIIAANVEDDGITQLLARNESPVAHDECDYP